MCPCFIYLGAQLIDPLLGCFNLEFCDMKAVFERIDVVRFLPKVPRLFGTEELELAT